MGILGHLKGPNNEEFYDFLRTLSSIDEALIVGVNEEDMDIIKAALQCGANIHYDSDKAIVRAIANKSYDRKIAIVSLKLVKGVYDFILPPHLDELSKNPSYISF